MDARSFEIVPYTILNEDYDEQGNPDLKHTVADNLDLRYEFFPKSSEQFMIGLFWKKLHDPIEYGLISEGQATYLTPMNFGDAVNAGVEVDIMKYFNWFGIKANYTYTHSSITTTKRAMDGTEVIAVTQTRPSDQASLWPGRSRGQSLAAVQIRKGGSGGSGVRQLYRPSSE